MSNSSPNIINNIITNNTAAFAGGISIGTSSPNIINNVIDNNSAEHAGGQGGGVWIASDESIISSPLINNNIITNNTANTGAGIYADASSTPIIDFNNVWSNSTDDYSGCSPGLNDISQDPLFVPAVDDYHLQSGSPCIDTGTNAGAPTEDIEANPRPIDGDGDTTADTDMGAYEYMPNENH
jgi:hypothetical protein